MTCRIREGGTPLCKLGHKAKSVEIRGIPFLQAKAIKNESTPDPQSFPPLESGSYDIFIVGMNPGADEDQSGFPFQGRAGEKLYSLVERSGLDQSKIFLTNLTRCKTPKNREPSKPEMAACRPYIIDEIKRGNPKVLILLGKNAFNLFNLGGEGGVYKIHGKLFEKPLPDWKDGPTFKVIPTFHPAAFLYRSNPQLERRVVDDYRLAGTVVSGKPDKNFYVPKWHLFDTVEAVEDLIKRIKEAGVVSFDTESPHAKFMQCPLICVSVCWGFPNKCGVIPFYKHDPNGELWKLKPNFTNGERTKVVDLLAEVLEDPRIEKIAFNFKYDYNVIRKHCLKSNDEPVQCRGFFEDPMLYHHLLDEQRPHDLEHLSDVELGTGDYSFKVRQITGQSKELRQTFDNIPDDILWPYTSTDSESAYRLREIYKSRLLKKPHLWKLYKEETEPAIHSLLPAEWKGARIDVNIVDELLEEYTKEQDELREEMRRKTWPDFNPGSPDQVAKAARQLGYGEAILDEDSASGYSTRKDVLTELAYDNEFFAQVLKYRNKDKLIKTYLVNAKNDLDPDGRLRYGWLLHGTATGRLSCRFYHQLPRLDPVRIEQNKPVIRSTIIPEDGYSFVQFDFSQIELHVMALLANDKEMIKILEGGGDIHLSTAAELLGIPEDGIGIINDHGQKFYVKAKDNRSGPGKNFNFQISYGGEGFRISKTTQWVDTDGNKHNLTWDMLREGTERWKSRFTGVAKYIDEVPLVALSRGGTIRTVFGRERRFGSKFNSDNEYEVKATEREAVNTTIQSPAGGILLRTLNVIDSHLRHWYNIGRLNPFDVFLVNNVHDSATYEVKDAYVAWFKEIVKKVATRPIPELQNHRFPIDIGVGKSLTEAELNSKC